MAWETKIVLQSHQKYIPDDFKLEVRLNENGKPYTSMFHIEGANPNKLAEELIALFSELYGIDSRHLCALSSFEPDGRILVGVVSRVPLPKPALPAPKQHTPIGSDFIEVDVTPCNSPLKLTPPRPLLTLFRQDATASKGSTTDNGSVSKRRKGR